MTYTAASSHGCAGRFMGTCSPKCVTASTGIVEGINGVQTGPGATALALIPFSAKSWASPPVKF